MLAKVHVILKAGVLDPPGKAVQNALADLGYDEVRDVSLGKYMEIQLYGRHIKSCEFGGFIEDLKSYDLIQPRPGQNWILVTSAFHMPRCIGIARKFNLNFIPLIVASKFTIIRKRFKLEITSTGITLCRGRHELSRPSSKVMTWNLQKGKLQSRSYKMYGRISCC